jgi:hypothetical protein
MFGDNAQPREKSENVITLLNKTTLLPPKELSEPQNKAEKPIAPLYSLLPKLATPLVVSYVAAMSGTVVKAGVK